MKCNASSVRHTVNIDGYNIAGGANLFIDYLKNTHAYRDSFFMNCSKSFKQNKNEWMMLHLRVCPYP